MYDFEGRKTGLTRGGRLDRELNLCQSRCPLVLLEIYEMS
jgi:hypothetical protein